MEIIWIILGFLLIIIGFIGLIAPILPSTIACYLALLLLHFAGVHAYSAETLIVLGVFTALTFAIDFIMPVLGTKKFGGTRYGVIGSTIGGIISIFVAPAFGIFALFVILALTFLGAYIGELITQKNNAAAYAAFGAMLGFLFSTFIKLGINCVITLAFLLGLACHFQITFICSKILFL